MTELSTRWPILYVDYQYTVKDLVTGENDHQYVPRRKVLRLVDPLTRQKLENGGEVYVWSPPAALPINWLSAGLHETMLQWTVNPLIKSLRQVMGRLKMTRPLVINAFNPVLGLPMIGKLNECATVYYCFDEILFGSWMSRHGHRSEQHYLQRVDAVITTSEPLRQAKARIQPRAFCVKNGANFDLFNTVLQLAKTSRSEKQVVGYLGIADRRIDIDLVDFCARTMPDVTFQFIGDINEPALPKRLAPYANVVFIPAHSPVDLPPLLARLTAAIIPFRCNEHTYTIFPLKIYEYLAAGLPVVSTPFSLLDEFRDIVELADTPENFAQALRRALADTSAERVKQRVELARANSWKKRADEFEAILEQLSADWKTVPQVSN